MKNFIEIKNLKKIYRGKSVIRDINFSVQKGSIHGFIGPNGAGKTTIIKILMGMIKPNEGEICLEGKKISENSYSNQKIGFMVELAKFVDNLRVEEFCQLMASLRNIPKTVLEERLRKSDLNDFRLKKCRELSTGWKKILLYFLAVLHDPDILILDEPTSGLDPSYQRILLEQLEQFKIKGGTVLISSHILSDLQKLVDSVTLINKGEIIYTGKKPVDIKKMYSKLVFQEKVIKKKQTWI